MRTCAAQIINENINKLSSAKVEIKLRIVSCLQNSRDEFRFNQNNSHWRMTQNSSLHIYLFETSSFNCCWIGFVFILKISFHHRNCRLLIFPIEYSCGSKLLRNSESNDAMDYLFTNTNFFFLFQINLLIKAHSADFLMLQFGLTIPMQYKCVDLKTNSDIFMHVEFNMIDYICYSNSFARLFIPIWNERTSLTAEVSYQLIESKTCHRLLLTLVDHCIKHRRKSHILRFW